MLEHLAGRLSGLDLILRSRARRLSQNILDARHDGLQSLRAGRSGLDEHFPQQMQKQHLVHSRARLEDVNGIHEFKPCFKFLLNHLIIPSGAAQAGHSHADEAPIWATVELLPFEGPKP